MTKSFHVISQNTGISLTIFGALCGAIVWMSFVAAKTDANAATIQEIANRQESYQEMKSDVAVIKSKVEDIQKLLQNR